MTKAIASVGEQPGIVFDPHLLQAAGAKAGDEYTVTVHDGGAITLTPVLKTLDPVEAGLIARDLIARNSELFRRLS